ncbi:putative nucleotidyltransferase substrate binding domain-containing protein [Vibrio tapetis subsp. quintayensis]|uniref:putative nucleotidyltransferase substrate binding domain-containing protein n=1 Tax=Vibrio tapetis TaxID=52443 RepID=UPI0025B4A540|nr:putative nucleotidyltransferase substrate binding domain-containing protein [Vibrio tapetis]MDN3681753.1 putative nucleotidyltransferase substrate binding domain-containing protein [Vibrio tapetis subsp. quintayensis]
MQQSLLPNIIQFISQIDPFDKLPKPILIKLAEKVQITYLGKGEVIDLCKDKKTEKFLYIVRTGSMEQRKPDGVLRARLQSEDLFGFTFLDHSVESEKGYTAIAIESSLLYLIPHAALKELFVNNPEYAEHFASQAQVRLKSALDVVWSNKEKGLFIRKVEDVASGRIAVVTADMSIQAVAHEMRLVQRSSSAVIYEDDKIVGIITDRDMTKRVIAKGVSIERPISDVMTYAPLTIKPDDLVLHAASVMMQFNIRNLPVVKDNKVLGLLTTSHLVQNHRVQAIFLIEKIKYAGSVKELAAFTSERQAIFEALVEGKVATETVGKVMAMIMDAYNRRLIQIAIDKLGPPPCEFAWIVAGSHARNEVHMLSDQDSAIVLSDSATDSDRIYFKHLSMMVANGLDSCAYPLCPGKFMAATPKWCQPISVWKQYYSKWVANPEYERLLNISVFLEVRAIYGNQSFGDEMRDSLHQSIRTNREFLSMLVRDAVTTNPPLGIFNNLVLEKSGENRKTLNVKKYAINLIIDLARIYGLAVECDSSSTDERFARAREKGILSEDAHRNILDAYRFILSVRYSHQLDALKKGEVPDNHIDPDSFGSFERKHLKDAFRIVADMQDAAKIRFGAR